MSEDDTRWAQAAAAVAASDAGAWPPQPGTVIAERYRLERVIGTGGMGAVLAAEHIGLGDRVAVKFLHPRLAKDAESLRRFEREAKATARIKSDHVVRVLDIGATAQGLPYIVMDLLEGCDLGHLISAGPIAIPLAADCVLQAAEALAEAHAAGIVHRDIKPSNLWLAQRRDGTPLVRVLDFGISKLLPVNGSEGPALTETQAVFGSPTYMSPEQIRSAKRVDHRTDVWALGVVIHELLTCTLPFDADNVAGVLAAIIGDPPIPLRARRQEASPELERLVLACLEKDPARRASLKDLAAGLRPFASPAGRLSADRIEATGKPILSMFPPGPSPASSDAFLALGKTEPDVIATQSRTLAPTTFLGVLAGMVFVLVLGIVALVKVVREPVTQASTDPSASGVPSPASTPSMTSAAAGSVASVALLDEPKPAAAVSAAVSASARPSPPLRPSVRPVHSAAPPPSHAAPPSPISQDRR